MPGIGTALGGALGQGLGALGSGKNIGQAAVQGVGTYGVGKLLGQIGAKLPGSGDGLPPLPPPIIFDENGNIVPGGSASGSGAGGVGTDDQGIWSTILSGVKKVLPSALGGSGSVDYGGLALGGLAGYQALNAANATKRSNELSDKALGLAEQNWAGGAPLRAAGTTGLLTPTKTNLSDVYRDVANPFAKRSSPIPSGLTPARRRVR